MGTDLEGSYVGELWEGGPEGVDREGSWDQWEER